LNSLSDFQGNVLKIVQYCLGLDKKTYICIRVRAKTANSIAKTATFLSFWKFGAYDCKKEVFKT